MNRAGSSCRRVTRPVKVTGSLTNDEGPNRNDETEPFCSSCGYSPTGEAQGWREEDNPASGDDLLEAILDAGNVSRAWKQVKANRGAPGIDGTTVDAFPDLFRGYWSQLKEELLQGTYTPSPVLRVEIDKPDGGKRP